MYGLRVSLKGHWRRLISHRLRNLGTTEVMNIRNILRRMGRSFISAVKRNVRIGAFNYPERRMNFLLSLQTVYHRTTGQSLTFLHRKYLMTRPLIETKQLLNSMVVVNLPSDFLNPSVFAGYLAGAVPHIPNPENGFRKNAIKDAYRLAKILHDGKIIKVTDKMRGHFIAHGIPLRDETNYIVIPPRPFVIDTARSEAFVEALAEKIGIYLGRVYTVNA